MEEMNSGAITVVHVDDEPNFAEMASHWLERELDECEILTATTVGEGLEYIDDATDCIVSDFDMPEMNGLEFLDEVRESYPEKPFILFTGKGSEEIASEAISRGVTDYIQKQTTSDVYTILANRIENAVDAYRAERAARETRQRYEKLITHASDIIFVVDPDGVFTYLSPAVEQVLGYPPEELTGELGFDYIHPEDRGSAAEEFARVVEDPDHIASIEFRGKHKDGSWVPLEIRGRNLLHDPQVEGIVVVGRDITERKERERELELTETLVQRSEDAFFVADRKTERVTYVNDTACQLLGYSREDLLETQLKVIQPTFSESATWNDHVKKLHAGDSIVYEDELVGQEGSRVPVEINATLESINGTDYIINVARDITHRKEYERTLQKRIDRLEELVSVVSHDLRNPLSVADGYLELARERYDSEDLEAAADALDRGLTLMDDLLELTQEYKETNQFQPVDLATVAEECWENVRETDARLVVETERTIRADPSRLMRVLENIFRNSVEHGSKGSRPQTDDSVEHDGTDATVTITIGDFDGDGFYIADDGPGVPEDERSEIFEAGYSTDSDGTGLGLSIVRTIVDAHGWDISVTESSQGGARFEITGVKSISRSDDGD